MSYAGLFDTGEGLLSAPMPSARSSERAAGVGRARLDSLSPTGSCSAVDCVMRYKAVSCSRPIDYLPRQVRDHRFDTDECTRAGGFP